MNNYKTTIKQIVALFKQNQIEGQLILEGSCANGTADEYSDIDFSLIVSSDKYYETCTKVLDMLSTMPDPIYILDGGEDMKFPGYYHIWGMYKPFGLFQIIDITVINKEQSNNLFHDNENLLYQNTNASLYVIDIIKFQFNSTDKEKRTAQFFMLQPGAIKSILRKQPPKIILDKIQLKTVRPLSSVCTKDEVESVNKLLKAQQWLGAIDKSVELYDQKTDIEDSKLDNLKKEILDLINTLKKQGVC